jgi:hypothetical protein
MMEGVACHRDLSDVIAAFFIVIASAIPHVIASRRRGNPRKSKTQKSKGKMRKVFTF